MLYNSVDDKFYPYLNCRCFNNICQTLTTTKIGRNKSDLYSTKYPRKSAFVSA